MITKIQNLSAIHNGVITIDVGIQLFMITKIQNLSAIHNPNGEIVELNVVVYDYKDTKFVSNSQLDRAG